MTDPAATAFQAWKEVDSVTDTSANIDFADWNIVPKGKRAVIELITASILTPPDTWPSLGLNTAVGTANLNLNLSVTPQGQTANWATYVATHSLRVYTDGIIVFGVRCPKPTGAVLISISGYIAD
jgi:hypothetical protein